MADGALSSRKKGAPGVTRTRDTRIRKALALRNALAAQGLDLCCAWGSGVACGCWWVGYWTLAGTVTGTAGGVPVAAVSGYDRGVGACQKSMYSPSRRSDVHPRAHHHPGRAVAARRGRERCGSKGGTVLLAVRTEAHLDGEDGCEPVGEGGTGK